MLLVALGVQVAPLHADTLLLKDGNRMEGAILGREGEAVQIEITRGGGKARLEMPVGRIESIRFTAGADAIPPGELERVWREREPFLDIQGSDAGAVGLAYAKARLATGRPEDARAMMPVIEKIRDASWSREDRTAAAQIRLTAMAAAGDVEQALAEARSLETMGAAETDELAATRVRARFVQARAAVAAWRKLEEDWPKWDLMPEMRAERRRLINEALDLYLFPVAHHAGLTALCAEGLIEAARIQHALGDAPGAQRLAREVIDHFPDPAFVRQAGEFIKPEPEKKDTPHD